MKDKLIEARVRTIVDAELSDTPFGSGISVRVADGTVTLQGVTSATGDVRSVLDKVADMDGVMDVRNDVLVARQAYGV